MKEIKVDDINVLSEKKLITPAQLKNEIRASKNALSTVAESRLIIKRILQRKDPRLLMVVGPCSIHDVDAAVDYATKLKGLANEVQDSLFLVMRVYFEKPRTTVGWKGLINDPYLNDSFDLTAGLQFARKLLVDLAEMGVPSAAEALDHVSPQYLQDMICWSAIGARTTESQTHREMASGLSSIVGFKNATDGNLDIAINALRSVVTPHRFLGINHQGQVSIISTNGNKHAHIVLRGGDHASNYDATSVMNCELKLRESSITPTIMIDCSHANSGKDHNRQAVVMDDIAEQIQNGNESIIGLMIESHLNPGKQQLTKGPDKLEYGVSITDACMDWETTRKVIKAFRIKVKESLSNRGIPMKVMQRSA